MSVEISLLMQKMEDRSERLENVLQRILADVLVPYDLALEALEAINDRH